MYSGKSGCIKAKVVVFGQVVVLWRNWLYSGNVVVFGQSTCNRTKCVFSNKNGCIREKVIVFG